MKPFPNRTSTFQRIRLSHSTLTLSWGIGASMHVYVAFLAECLCRFALSAIRHHAREE
jgi:hypothetical protein